MTSLTWRFETGPKLIGCGVDCETADRFVDIAAGFSHPMPFAFTGKEIDHARHQRDSARALCLCFTCKEALLKALGEPYNFTDCELFPALDDASSVIEEEVVLGPHLKRDGGISRAICRSVEGASRTGEIISAVYLFGEGRS